jgi:hypothetical protein
MTHSRGRERFPNKLIAGCKLCRRTGKTRRSRSYALDKRGLRENTRIIFSRDNGGPEESGKYGLIAPPAQESPTKVKNGS